MACWRSHRDRQGFAARLPDRAKAALICGMNFFVQRSELRDLYDKVAVGERISEAGALRFCDLITAVAAGNIAEAWLEKRRW
jgi:hypothetical protein